MKKLLFAGFVVFQLYTDYVLLKAVDQLMPPDPIPQVRKTI